MPMSAAHFAIHPENTGGWVGRGVTRGRGMGQNGHGQMSIIDAK